METVFVSTPFTEHISSDIREREDITPSVYSSTSRTKTKKKKR